MIAVDLVLRRRLPTPAPDPLPGGVTRVVETVLSKPLHRPVALEVVPRVGETVEFFGWPYPGEEVPETEPLHYRVESVVHRPAAGGRVEVYAVGGWKPK